MGNELLVLLIRLANDSQRADTANPLSHMPSEKIEIIIIIDKLHPRDEAESDCLIPLSSACLSACREFDRIDRILQAILEEPDQTEFRSVALEIFQIHESENSHTPQV